MRLLLIQSSSNPGSSYSRRWSEKVVDHLKKKHPQLALETLDLCEHAVPAVTPLSVAASFTPQAQRNAEQSEAIALSEQLVDQFLNADVIVLGIPMYNFGVPANFKAYVDQIVRVGKTFQYTPTGPVGLVTGPKKLIVVSSSGGIYSEGPAKGSDFLEPYLKTLFGFLGLKDINFIRLEGTALGEAQITKVEQLAAKQIEVLS